MFENSIFSWEFNLVKGSDLILYGIFEFRELHMLFYLKDRRLRQNRKRNR